LNRARGPVAFGTDDKERVGLVGTDLNTVAAVPACPIRQSDASYRWE